MNHVQRATIIICDVSICSQSWANDLQSKRSTTANHNNFASTIIRLKDMLACHKPSASQFQKQIFGQNKVTQIGRPFKKRRDSKGHEFWWDSHLKNNVRNNFHLNLSSWSKTIIFFIKKLFWRGCSQIMEVWMITLILNWAKFSPTRHDALLYFLICNRIKVCNKYE